MPKISVEDKGKNAKGEYMHSNLSPQNQRIMELLRSGMSLTGLDAVKLVGSIKLSTRISELRALGFEIKDETIQDNKTKKHYKRYWIPDRPPRTEIEESIARSNFIQEEAINYKATGKQLELPLMV